MGKGQLGLQDYIAAFPGEISSHVLLPDGSNQAHHRVLWEKRRCEEIRLLNI